MDFSQVSKIYGNLLAFASWQEMEMSHFWWFSHALLVQQDLSSVSDGLGSRLEFAACYHCVVSEWPRKPPTP